MGKENMGMAADLGESAISTDAGDDMDVYKNPDSVEDFLVSIKYTQHHTWQGTVTCVGMKKKASFRSALELIKLMDSAIEKEE